MNIDIEQLKAGDLVLTPPEPRSEKEIMANWKGDASKPLVSIVCPTYNHVDYIKDALNSFLMQETDFPFEIIINDDASTDGTTLVIESYASSYPNIIRAVIQKENKYSQGVKPGKIIYVLARGEYISYCEGDDYWVSKSKISQQFYNMEKNKEAYICFHSALEVNELSGDKRIICQRSNEKCFISSKTIIVDRGGSMPSPSLFFRNKNIGEMLASYEHAPIGDFFVQSYMALTGKVLFLPEAMCVYRRNSKNSWTSSQAEKNKRIEYNLKMIKAIDDFYGVVKDKDESDVLILTLCFYIKQYLLNYKNPLKVIRLCNNQISTLEHFNKLDIVGRLFYEIPLSSLNRLKNKVNYLRVKNEL